MKTNIRFCFVVVVMMLIAMLFLQGTTILSANEPDRSVIPSEKQILDDDFDMSSDSWSWFREIVDTDIAGTCCYGDVSLAIDQGGFPHTSYYDQVKTETKYAYKDITGWHISTLDEAGGKHSSLVLDSKGYPHILYWQYQSYSQCGVRYTFQDAAGWRTETVADVNNACSLGGHTSIVLDENETPHISYGDYDQKKVIYGYLTNEGWQLEAAVDRAGAGNSLALDKDGNPHIAYYQIYNGDLYYTHRDGAGWHKQRITTDFDGYPTFSMKLDGEDIAHIAYNSDWSGSTGECLKYAFGNASGWQIENVDCEGFHPGEASSLSLDSSGGVHISYEGDGGLYYAYRNEDGWSTERVEGLIPTDSSLLVDDTGRKHIVFTNHSKGVLKL